MQYKFNETISLIYPVDMIESGQINLSAVEYISGNNFTMTKKKRKEKDVGPETSSVDKEHFWPVTLEESKLPSGSSNVQVNSIRAPTKTQRYFVT